MCINILKPYIELGQSVVTIGAIIVGGIWTYMLFVKGRSTYPRLKLKHTIYSRDIDQELRFLRVALTLENQSTILVKTGEITLRLLQLEPWPDDLVNRKVHFRHDQESYAWPYIDYRDIEPTKVEIEPGELEEYYFDFVIDRGRRAVIVYSWVQNLQKKEIGWTLSTAHNLDTKETEMKSNPKKEAPNKKGVSKLRRLTEQKAKEKLSSKAPPPNKSGKPGGTRQAPKQPLPPPAKPPKLKPGKS
jgi:hypothetical protein